MSTGDHSVNEVSMETQSNTLRWKELKLPVPWGHIAAKAWGHARDKQVLLVHGIMDNAGSFDRLIRLLPETFYYVCIDLPGHGLSSHFPPGIPLDFFAFVYSILLTLEALEWQRCIYIGHSFGSMLGIMFTALYPARIEKFVSLDGIIPNPIPNHEMLSFVRDLYNTTQKSFEITNRNSYSKEEVLHALMFKRSSTLNTQAAEAMFERAVTKVDTMYKFNRDLRTRLFIKPIFNMDQYMEIMKTINIPILIILASDSLPEEILLDVVRTLKILRPDITTKDLHVIEGNHDVHNNNPERVAPFICKTLIESIESKL